MPQISQENENRYFPGRTPGWLVLSMSGGKRTRILACGRRDCEIILWSDLRSRAHMRLRPNGENDDEEHRSLSASIPSTSLLR